MGIVERLRKLLDRTADQQERATLEEAIDLLCQAGWGRSLVRGRDF